MDASENTLKKQIIQLLCSGELLFGVNYEQQIIDLSNYCDASFNDIRAEIAQIVTEASVTPQNISTMSTGIGLGIQPLYDDRVLRTDLSTVSTGFGLALANVNITATEGKLGLSTLSTTIGTSSNLFTSFSSITLAGLSSLSSPIGSTLIALNQLTLQTYAGLSSLSTTVGTLSNLFTAFSTVTLAGLSSLSTPIGNLSTNQFVTSNVLASNISTNFQTTQAGISSISAATGTTSNLFTAFSTITLAGLSSLSTGLGNTNSTLVALASTTRAGLSSLSSQIGLALFAIPSTVSTGLSLASTMRADEIYASTLWVLSDAQVYGVLRVGTGTTTITTDSVDTTSTFTRYLRASSNAFINYLSVGTLASTDLSAAASTLSTTVGQQVSTISVTIANLQPVSTLRDFRASNLSSVNFSAGNRPYWLMTGTGIGPVSTLARSFDGLTWESVANANATTNNKAVWNGDHWLLCGGGAGPSLQRSVDGATWTTIPIGLNPVYSATWNGSQWLAAGVSTNGQTMAKSTDGIRWTALTTPFWEEARGSVWNGTTWIAYGKSYSVGGTDPYFITSSIAIYNPTNDTFTTQTISSIRVGSLGNAKTQAIIDMDFNPRGFFAAIGDINALYSNDGGGWKDFTIPSFVSPSITLTNTTIKGNGSIVLLGFNSNSLTVPNNYIYNSTTNFAMDSGYWSKGQIPLSSVTAIYYNSNDNYWLATGSNLENSTTAYSVDGINWTRAGSNLRIGTGLAWSGQANCNVARVWGQLTAHSIVAASSFQTVALTTLLGTISSLNAGSISSPTISGGFSTLSTTTGFTSNTAVAGLSSLSTGAGWNFSTLSSLNALASNVAVAGLSSLSIAVAAAYASASTVSTNYGWAVSTLSSGVWASLTGLSTLSTTAGSNNSTATSAILSTLGVISTFSNAFSTQMVGLSTLVSTNFVATRAGLSSLSTVVAYNFSTLSSYCDASLQGVCTLSTALASNISTLSTQTGYAINTLSSGVWANNVGLSSLSTPLGYTASTVSAQQFWLSSLSVNLFTNISTLSSYIYSIDIRQITVTLPANLVCSTLTTPSTIFTSTLITSTLNAGPSIIRTISSMSAEMSSVRIATVGLFSTVTIDDICRASTFIGSFAFSIQVF